MEKASTNEAIHRFYLTTFTFTLLQSQTEINTMTEETTSLGIIFPPIKVKPQNQVSADWLLLFLLGCRAAVAKWSKRVESGKNAALIRSLAKLAMLSAWCYCTNQKLGYREPLWNVDAFIWSVTHHFLCQCLKTRLVALPAGYLAKGFTWTFCKSICVVNQQGKRDLMHLTGCRAHMSHMNIEQKVSLNVTEYFIDIDKAGYLW